MAQVIIVKRNVAVQTGDHNEFIIFLTNKKTAREFIFHHAIRKLY